MGRSICTSHPNPKISKKIAISLSEEKMRNAALYPQTTHIINGVGPDSRQVPLDKSITRATRMTTIFFFKLRGGVATPATPPLDPPVEFVDKSSRVINLKIRLRMTALQFGIRHSANKPDALQNRGRLVLKE